MSVVSKVLKTEFSAGRLVEDYFKEFWVTNSGLGKIILFPSCKSCRLNSLASINSSCPLLCPPWSYLCPKCPFPTTAPVGVLAETWSRQLLGRIRELPFSMLAWVVECVGARKLILRTAEFYFERKQPLNYLRSHQHWVSECCESECDGLHLHSMFFIFIIFIFFLSFPSPAPHTIYVTLQLIYHLYIFAWRWSWAETLCSWIYLVSNTW